jgi:ectoine hydroxylase-related dioxygenase (phytanoyl-CoA dioxygenase family)
MPRQPASVATVDSVCASLSDQGWCIVTDLLSAPQVRAARTELDALCDALPGGRNPFEGFATQRIYALFAKTRTLDAAATHPLVLGVALRLLGHHQLSAPTGIRIGPGEQSQVLHRDQSIYPLPADFPDVVLNTMWALDDFTADNGATRLVPGSHTWTDLLPRPEEATVQAVMPAGSVLFYGGRLWHGGGANRTGRSRLGVILEYAASWLRQQETHLLSVPREMAASLDPTLQELLGYNIFPPFMGYVDGRHPRRVLDGLPAGTHPL